MLNIKVHNQANVPEIYVSGTTIQSDNSRHVTFEDKEWIDESGKASYTSSGTVYQNAASWNFDSPDTPPSNLNLRPNLEIRKTGKKQYEMTIQKGQDYVVKYKNVE